jgi:hypothetical protein
MRKTEGNRPKTQGLPSSQLEAVARGNSLQSGSGSRTVPHIPRPALNTMLAKRYELKYRIPEPMAHAVKGFISAFLGPDPYSRIRPNGQYPICSLYLDSRRFDLFRETQLDKCNRFKLRIRCYDDEPLSPVFFEIKRKLNRVVYKSRARVSKDRLDDILRGHYLPPEATEADRTVLRQFVHYTQCLMARPVVLVRYMREAFENRTDARVRVTFDRQLSYQVMDKPVIKLNGPGWRKVPINFVVLEIKFTGQFPSWLTDMVRLFELNRQSMSKYCQSVRYIVPRGMEFPPASL